MWNSKLKTGNYSTKIKLYVEREDGTEYEVIVTGVRYYRGYTQTKLEPAEPESVDIVEAELEDGTPIDDWEEWATHDHYRKIEREFKESRGY